MSDKEVTRQYRIQQWAAAIQDQKASGLTIAQWCNEHQVSRYQFFYRQKVVRKVMSADLEKYMESTFAVPARIDGNTIVTRKPEQPVSFEALPASALPEKTGVSLRLQYGSSIIEVSNDASDRILSLLREVILHAE